MKVKDDSKITFRLNGIFEYFLAYHMSQDDDFKDLILNEDSIYLSFKNEMEIYSGIKNSDSDFLEFIYNKTKRYFKSVNEGFRNQGTPDENLQIIISQDHEIKLSNIVKSIKAINPLNNEDQDLIKDDFDPVSINSSIAKKRIYNPSDMDSEIYERYISVLARVYKTMDGINDEQILNEILDFLLETYINFSFYLSDELDNNSKDSNNDKESLLDLINKFLPFISQITFSDSIANYNVEGIILNKIRELKRDHKSNQYKLFILYFILMDIDEANIIKYADELLPLMSIGILRYTSLMKLSYYFAFNGNKNAKLAEFLRNRIESAQINLDGNIDRNKLKQSLDKKKNLLNFNNRLRR
ncbi:hypothetical protein EON78_05355 [bacterium]|nr:MAG: hypothetical protein EON78_05355 [bacterium]